MGELVSKTSIMEHGLISQGVARSVDTRPECGPLVSGKQWPNGSCGRALGPNGNWATQ